MKLYRRVCLVAVTIMIYTLTIIKRPTPSVSGPVQSTSRAVQPHAPTSPISISLPKRRTFIGIQPMRHAYRMRSKVDISPRNLTGLEEKQQMLKLYQCAMVLKGFQSFYEVAKYLRLSEIIPRLQQFKEYFSKHPNQQNVRYGSGYLTPVDVVALYKNASYIHSIIYDPRVIEQTLEVFTQHLRILLTRDIPDQPRPAQCNRCNDVIFKTLINPDSVCSGGEHVTVIALITSAPLRAASRKVIRRIWGAFSAGNTANVRFVFLFGSGFSKNQQSIINRESTKYNDILQSDYKDSYYNLTVKMLVGYRWVLRHCARADFVMRAADDTFVHFPRLLGLIDAVGSGGAFQKHQVGSCFPRYIPHRIPDFKGYISMVEYPRPALPPYAHGTTFLTSMDLTRKIVDMSVNIPLFPIEDAYFGLVLQKLGRGCHNVEGFVQEMDFFGKACHKNWFSMHGVNPFEMTDFQRTCL